MFDEDGLTPLPLEPTELAPHRRGELWSFCVGAGERGTLQAIAQVPLRGPYRLGISPGFHVEEVLFGNISIFATCGSVPSDLFQNGETRPRNFTPLEGPVLHPGVYVRLGVANRSNRNLELSATLWASTLPRYMNHAIRRTPKEVLSEEFERERRRLLLREQALEKQLADLNAAREAARRDRIALHQERAAWRAEQVERRNQEQREQLERDPAWLARETDRRATELEQARRPAEPEQEGGAWSTACDES